MRWIKGDIAPHVDVGPAAFERSTLRQKINYGDNFAARHEFLRWIYVKGKIINGLVIRRYNEAELFKGNKVIL
jgi:lysozyme